MKMSEEQQEAVLATLEQLIARFEFQVAASMFVFGTNDESTMPAVQAFKHAIAMTERLKEEVAEQ